MKTKFNIIILLLLVSCSKPSTLDLESNKTVNENFNKSEVDDLQIIFDFFNSEICDSVKYDNETLNKCYNEYCSRIRFEQSESDGFFPQIDFQKQLLMYERINKTTFNEIWEFQKSWKTRESDTLKYLSLNHNGKFKNFLKSFSVENKSVNSYYDSFDMSNDITPTMYADLIMDYESYNTSDLRTKLLIAIHYLTFNDQVKRIEKY